MVMIFRRGGDDDGKPVSGPVVPPYTLPRQSRLTPRVTSKMHRPMRSPHNYTAPANSSDGKYVRSYIITGITRIFLSVISLKP